MGDKAQVTLRRALPADADLLDAWARPEFTGAFNRFGMPYRPYRQLIEENALVGEHGGTLIVLADGEPAGTVSWRSVRYGPTQESVAWNIGINLIPDARGRGFGPDAQRALAEYLLANTAVNRIEAMTDVDNTPEQRALEKAGFAREGVLLGAQFRDGAWHDLIVYSRVRRSDDARP